MPVRMVCNSSLVWRNRSFVPAESRCLTGICSARYLGYDVSCTLVTSVKCRDTKLIRLTLNCLVAWFLNKAGPVAYVLLSRLIRRNQLIIRCSTRRNSTVCPSCRFKVNVKTNSFVFWLMKMPPFKLNWISPDFYLYIKVWKATQRIGLFQRVWTFI